jgi:RNA polymerase sigma factor (TIGR02999 family)
MVEPPPGDVTRLLAAWKEGDRAAPDLLLALVYDELRRMARHHLRRQQPGHTLQTTALIHDAYLRLVGQAAGPWQDRNHFFAVSAQAMRHILVDHARARQSAKRGGGARAVSLDEAALVTVERAAELIALDDALEELKGLHERQCRVVECRYFGGMTVQETAEVLGVSPETVMRDWKMAKAWLHRALVGGAEE